jgi:hypothetical protein
MHTDDHILETLVAAKGPLPAIAAELRMSFIALIRWMDAHADLIATAKRAIESHIKLLSLRAEAVALIDLTNVSTSTPNEERKRKSATQLLRHTAKRLLSSLSPPSPRHSGEKCLSEAKAMRGSSTAPSANESCSSTNPTRKRARSVSDGPSASSLTDHAGSPANLLHSLVASGVPPVPTRSNSSSPHAPSSLLSSCGSAPALHQPDIVTQAVVAGLHMGMRIPGFTLADCHPHKPDHHMIP